MKVLLSHVQRSRQLILDLESRGLEPLEFAHKPTPNYRSYLDRPPLMPMRTVPVLADIVLCEVDEPASKYLSATWCDDNGVPLEVDRRDLVNLVRELKGLPINKPEPSREDYPLPVKGDMIEVRYGFTGPAKFLVMKVARKYVTGLLRSKSFGAFRVNVPVDTFNI